MSDAKFVVKAVNSTVQRELSGRVPVGRGELEGLALTALSTSREHALLSVVDGEAYLEEIKAKNGTFVNDQQVRGRQRLRDGDKIRFANEEYTIQRIETSGETVVIAHNPEAPKNRDVGWINDVVFDDKDHTLQCSPEQLRDLEKKSLARRQANLAAPPVTEPCLVFTGEEGPGSTIPLRVDTAPIQEWIVGRRAECDIHIDARSVSGVHAKILRDGAKWFAIDALSANGMFVNGFQAGKQFLSAGDSIRFGNVECIFRLPRRVRPAKKLLPKASLYIAVALGTCLLILVLWWLARTYFPHLSG